MPALPDGLAEVRSTRPFDADTTPAGLRADHTTRADTWGRLVVEEGRVTYVLQPSSHGDGGTFELAPGTDGVIPPAVPHHVVPHPGCRFRVVFVR